MFGPLKWAFDSVVKSGNLIVIDWRGSQHPIGVALGLIALLAIWVTFGSITVGLGVAISLFVAATLASAIGLVLPWMLSRFHLDPAFGSGPVARILQDVLTIIIYFVVMTSLIG